MKKLEALKVGGVQRKEKKKKNAFCKLKSLFFLLLLLLFLCISKIISTTWGSAPITF